MADTVTLYDAGELFSGEYDGHWSLHLAPGHTLPFSGPINEIDFAVWLPDKSTICAFYVENPALTTTQLVAGGFDYDTIAGNASAGSWNSGTTWEASGWLPQQALWVVLYDSGWNPWPCNFAVTVDPASIASWADVPVSIGFNSATQSSIVLDYNGGTLAGVKASSCALERAPHGGEYTQIASKLPPNGPYIDSGLASSTVYTYRLTATYPAGTSQITLTTGTEFNYQSPVIKGSVAPVSPDPLVTNYARQAQGYYLGSGSMGDIVLLLWTSGSFYDPAPTMNAEVWAISPSGGLTRLDGAIGGPPGASFGLIQWQWLSVVPVLVPEERANSPYTVMVFQGPQITNFAQPLYANALTVTVSGSSASVTASPRQTWNLPAYGGSGLSNFGVLPLSIDNETIQLFFEIYDRSFVIHPVFATYGLGGGTPDASFAPTDPYWADTNFNPGSTGIFKVGPRQWAVWNGGVQIFEITDSGVSTLWAPSEAIYRTQPSTAKLMGNQDLTFGNLMVFYEDGKGSQYQARLRWDGVALTKYDDLPVAELVPCHTTVPPSPGPEGTSSGPFSLGLMSASPSVTWINNFYSLGIHALDPIFQNQLVDDHALNPALIAPFLPNSSGRAPEAEPVVWCPNGVVCVSGQYGFANGASNLQPNQMIFVVQQGTIADTYCGTVVGPIVTTLGPTGCPPNTASSAKAQSAHVRSSSPSIRVQFSPVTASNTTDHCGPNPPATAKASSPPRVTRSNSPSRAPIPT